MKKIKKNKNRKNKNRPGREKPAFRRSGGAPAKRRFPHSAAPARTGGKSVEGEGVFAGTRNGYGFVSVAELDEDVFIPAGKTYGAIDGDRVRIRYRRGTEGRYDGEVSALLSETKKTVIGTYVSGSSLTFRPRGRSTSRYYVIPDDPRLSFCLPVAPSPEAENGDKVEASLIGRREMHGEVVRVFGPTDSKAANYDAILAGCGIEREFSPDAISEAERRAALPLSDEGRIRRDREIILTIDGADAKDLDDAVSLRRLPGGKWLLGVHIADVSSYVLPKTPLDRAAMGRGTSVYFVDQVIPMLPTALSNGACSLNAGEDKYALSAILTLEADGAISKCKIERSVIRSRVRGVYSEVNDLFANGTASEFAGKYREVFPTLTRMRELYLILAQRSRRRGAISLDRAEAQILLDAEGYPLEIVRAERGDAERMIEQFMLAANEGVANLLHERGVPCVYRIHEDPPAEKMAEFALYARNLGFDTSRLTGRNPRGADFSALLDEAETRGLKDTLSYPLLRALSKARYSEIPHRHFGLGISLYCHFTSPIRRLSDLATHRMLGAVLLGGEPAKKYAGYAARAAAAATEAELRALDAERRIEAMYKALYLSRHLGEEFLARVSAVTAFGVFAELDNTAEGLIPLDQLPGFFLYDEKNHSLNAGAKVIRLGDRLIVRVEEVEAMQGKVRFALVSHGEDIVEQSRAD